VDDGGLFEREGRLRGQFERKGIVPWEGDFDLSETELEQFELAKVLVKEIPRCRRVSSAQRAACTSR
jgi:hypothetical protein